MLCRLLVLHDAQGLPGPLQATGGLPKRRATALETPYLVATAAALVKASGRER
jgi:hypothetical protein